MSFPLSEALICAQPYLGVISAQRGGSRSQAGKETSFLLSSPGLCVSVHFRMGISVEPKRFGKVAPRRPASLHFTSLLYPLRVSLSFFLLSPLGWLWLRGGLTSPLLFSVLRSTPLRPIPERSGLYMARDDRGVGWGGPAGVSALLAASGV